MPPFGNTAFFVRGDDGEEYGPVDLDELRDWVRENRAGLGTVVRAEGGDPAWQPWQHYPELVALLAEAQAGASSAVPAALVLAPLLRRVLAFALDLVLVYVLLIPIIVVTWIVFFPDIFAQLNQASQLFLTRGQAFQYALPLPVAITMQLILAGGFMLYMVGFHWAHGQTPGKALLRLRVVDRNGLKPDGRRALTRSLVVCLSLYFWGFPFLSVFFNSQRRALHDIAAGTCVVET